MNTLTCNRNIKVCDVYITQSVVVHTAYDRSGSQWRKNLVLRFSTNTDSTMNPSKLQTSVKATFHDTQICTSQLQCRKS